MDVSRIPTGRDAPHDINVVIEIPQGSSVKYEIDKDSGAVFVDRFLFTPTAYPAAYGFIPGTLADDGDPADAVRADAELAPLRRHGGPPDVPIVVEVAALGRRRAAGLPCIGQRPTLRRYGVVWGRQRQRPA